MREPTVDERLLFVFCLCVKSHSVAQCTAACISATIHRSNLRVCVKLLLHYRERHRSAPTASSWPLEQQSGATDTHVRGFSQHPPRRCSCAHVLRCLECVGLWLCLCVCFFKIASTIRHRPISDETACKRFVEVDSATLKAAPTSHTQGWQARSFLFVVSATPPTSLRTRQACCRRRLRALAAPPPCTSAASSSLQSLELTRTLLLPRVPVDRVSAIPSSTDHLASSSPKSA